MVLKSRVEEDLFLPGSQALVLKTTGDAKPLFFNGFLLTFDPYKMPDIIYCLPVRDTG
jgi:hypothetical protein